MSRFTVEKQGYNWIVCKNGARVFGPSSWGQAEAKRDALERAARSRVRPCLTCKRDFTSEGAHHRMCNECRRLGGAELRPSGVNHGRLSKALGA